LRLAEGIDLAAYEKRWSAALDAGKIAALARQGFVVREDERLTATPSGPPAAQPRDRGIALEFLPPRRIASPHPSTSSG